MLRLSLALASRRAAAIRQSTEWAFPPTRTQADRSSAPGSSSRRSPNCGRVERISICQEEGCGQAFVPQPGCSTNLCPLHDPKLDGAPGSYRPYKTKKAMECARCGERILE